MPARLAVTVFSLALLLFGACARTSPSSDASLSPREASVPQAPDSLSRARAWADSVCSLMSLRQQAAQLVMPALYTVADAGNLRQLKEYVVVLNVGGVLLLKGEASSAAVMADSVVVWGSGMEGFPGLFFALDAENGLGMRFSDAPTFPWNRSVSPDADTGLFFDYGREVAREANVAGVNMILGPVADVGRAHLEGGGAMKYRTLGNDPRRVADLSCAYLRGLKAGGVIGVIKHFPGHGPTSVDSHRKLPVITLRADELFAVDLLPFGQAVRDGVPAVMVGHILAAALDSVERPASFSPAVIDGLLRDEMGFDGLVLVDAVNMAGADGFTGADAVAAGADIIVAPADTRREIDGLVAAVADGSLPAFRLEESCRRVLMMKFLYGVNSPSPVSASPDTIRERLHREAPSIISRLKSI